MCQELIGDQVTHSKATAQRLVTVMELKGEFISACLLQCAMISPQTAKSTVKLINDTSKSWLLVEGNSYITCSSADSRKEAEDVAKLEGGTRVTHEPIKVEN